MCSQHQCVIYVRKAHVFGYKLFRQAYRCHALLTYCPECKEKETLLCSAVAKDILFIIKRYVDVNAWWAVTSHVQLSEHPSEIITSTLLAHVREFKLVLTYICCYITICIWTKKTLCDEVLEAKIWKRLKFFGIWIATEMLSLNSFMCDVRHISYFVYVHCLYAKSYPLPEMKMVNRGLFAVCL